MKLTLSNTNPFQIEKDRPPIPYADGLSMLGRLILTDAFKVGEEFTLSSGAKSNVYFNLKNIMFTVIASKIIGSLAVRTMQKYNCSYVGGLEVGAIPIVSAVVSSFDATILWHFGFFVRKQPKDHGSQSLIEGVDASRLKDKSILIVEDVTTSGASAIKATDAVLMAGGIVKQVFTIIDREEGAEEALAAKGIELLSIFKKSDFIQPSTDKFAPKHNLKVQK